MPMASTAMTLTEAREKLQRMQSTVKRYRAEAEGAATRAIHSTMTVAGGITVGMVRAFDKQPGVRRKVPGTNLPLEVALASATTAAGVLGAFGRASDEIAVLGAGMGAVSAADVTERAVREVRKAAAKDD